MSGPGTSTGRSLRRLPWILAALSLLTLALRFAIRGSDVPVWGFALTIVTTVAVLALWTRRLDRQTEETARGIGALFACSTTLQYRLLRNTPRLQPLLSSVRWSSLVGGWLLGKLLVTEDGVTFVPNSWTRSLFKVPTVALDWNEIVFAAAVDQPDPRDPGILELRMRDGAEIAFMVTRRARLADVLERVRPS